MKQFFQKIEKKQKNIQQQNDQKIKKYFRYKKIYLFAQIIFFGGIFFIFFFPPRIIFFLCTIQTYSIVLFIITIIGSLIFLFIYLHLKPNLQKEKNILNQLNTINQSMMSKEEKEFLTTLIYHGYCHIQELEKKMKS